MTVLLHHTGATSKTVKRCWTQNQRYTQVNRYTLAHVTAA